MQGRLTATKAVACYSKQCLVHIPTAQPSANQPLPFCVTIILHNKGTKGLAQDYNIIAYCNYAQCMCTAKWLIFIHAFNHGIMYASSQCPYTIKPILLINPVALLWCRTTHLTSIEFAGLYVTYMYINIYNYMFHRYFIVLCIHNYNICICTLLTVPLL